MDRSKIVAVVTGAISIILAIAYLFIVQLLDFRGEMLPAPQSQLLQPIVVANGVWVGGSGHFTTLPTTYYLPRG